MSESLSPKAKYRVFQQNVRYELGEQDSLRINRLAEIIKSGAYEIVILQEVVDEVLQRGRLQHLLPDYHFVFSHKPFREIQYPLKSYIPFLFGSLLGLMRGVAYGLDYYVYALVLLSCSMHPSILLRLLSLGLFGGRRIIKNQTCQSGLAIGMKKATFQDINLVESNSFTDNAYQLPPLISWGSRKTNFADFGAYFVLQMVGAPGYLLVSAVDKRIGQKIFVANTHLTCGLENRRRMKQVTELCNMLDTMRGRCSIILGMDANSTPESREVQFLLKQGFIDCWLEKGKGVGYMWDNTNEMAKLQKIMKEPDARVDYIMVRPNNFLLSVHTAELSTRSDVSDHFGLISSFSLERTHKAEKMDDTT